MQNNFEIIVPKKTLIIEDFFFLKKNVNDRGFFFNKFIWLSFCHFSFFSFLLMPPKILKAVQFNSCLHYAAFSFVIDLFEQKNFFSLCLIFFHMIFQTLRYVV